MSTPAGAVFQGTPGSLLPNPFLYTLPRVLWGKQKDFFGYTATFNPLAASASLSVQTVIQNDSAFIIIAAVATVTDSPADTTVQSFVPQTVQIQDQTAGTNFFDQPTHFMNLFGTATNPLYWALPRLVPPGSTLTTTLNNLEANARIVRILFIGFKVFNRNTNE